jgi:hypothetical protein
MTDQYALPLIEHEHRGVLVPQRAKDGYVNATAMCKAAGKNWSDYNRIGPTRAFFAELSSELGLPMTELIQSVSGGTPQLQGTWVHPYVAINLGQWLSPQFSVQVSKWVTEWIAGGPQIVERMPKRVSNRCVRQVSSFGNRRKNCWIVRGFAMPHYLPNPVTYVKGIIVVRRIKGTAAHNGPVGVLRRGRRLSLATASPARSGRD